MKKSALLSAAFALAFACNYAGGYSSIAKTTAGNSSGTRSADFGKRLLSMNAKQSTSSDFALKLFSETCKGSKEQNVLVSPFSAYAALSMTLNGADSHTLTQMAKVLGVSGGDVAALNAKFEKLLADINANDKVQFEVANAIYADESTPFKKTFIDLCKKVYGAEVHNEDFKKKEAVIDKINAWCNEKTHGKISSILDKMTPLDKMVLLNAIYFKGAWQEQFKPGNTQDDKFNTASGEKVPVKMMHQQEHFAYFKGSNFSAISMKYQGYKQSMYIFLPDSGVSMDAFESQFTRENWTSWMEKFDSSHEVVVSMPRFKVEYSTNLNDTLKAMGMTDAFERTADFSKMISPPYKAWIGRVLQKTYMDVNEEGTEAAAVTAVVMMAARAMMRRDEPIQFRVDRPFALAMVDEQSGEILFLGKIMKP
ncbi:MAG TPA: serpin family protein [Chroococcales cyanobacterium]